VVRERSEGYQKETSEVLPQGGFGGNRKWPPTLATRTKASRGWGTPTVSPLFLASEDDEVDEGDGHDGDDEAGDQVDAVVPAGENR